MEVKNIRTLSAMIEEYIQNRGQSNNSLSNYHYILSVFIQFCECNNDGIYTPEIGLRCLCEHYGISGLNECLSRNDCHRKTALRVCNILNSLFFDKPIKNRYIPTKEKNLKNQSFLSALDHFIGFYETYDYSKKTIEHYRKNTSDFLMFADSNGYKNFEDFSNKLVYQYVQTLSRYTKITIRAKLSSIRIFLRFLNTEGYTTEYLEEIIKPAKMRCQLKIPSVWRKEEVLKMLSVIDRGNPCGKRDYAIILLITRLGFRISDINSLEFQNIDWKKKTINIIQHKTHEPLTVPLLNDVGWAIIDYLRNGRPNIDSPYVFLTHVPPFKNFSIENHHHRMIEKYMQWAHLPISGKRRLGMHSLRHTLATIMLENHEDHHNISAVLGHSSIDSTQVYLKTSIELLKECTLPLPEVSNDF